MEGRKKIADQVGTPMMIEVQGERFRWSDCTKFAEIANLPAEIHDSVLIVPDGRFLRLVIVAQDETAPNPYGIIDGWYAARWIDQEEARKWREAWGLLREQPKLFRPDR